MASLDSLGKIQRASHQFKVPLSRAAARFFHLHVFRKFSSDEIFALALLDPAITTSDLRTYVSKERAWPLYEKFNAHADRQLLNDKRRFYEDCLRYGLPVLRVAATLSRDEVASLRSQVLDEKLADYNDLLSRLPDRFVIKPSHGLQGKGVSFFRRQSGAIAMWSGTPVPKKEFVESMWSSLGTSTVDRSGDLDGPFLLIQHAGLAHPAIKALTGSEIMQSVRICTIVNDQGLAEVLFSFCKFVVGSNLIDNFEKGKTGNLIAYPALDSGRILRAIRSDLELGMGRTVSHHPDTRALLSGFEIPYWHEACKLALRAASVFKNCRSVGWDVGIGPDGPVLLEGNGTWDPLAPVYRSLPRIR